MRLAAVLLIACSLALGERVVLETQLGAIEIDVDSKRAPSTAANFLQYVRDGAYNGGLFHRTVTPSNQRDNNVKIEVVQASPKPGTALRPPIKLERTSSTGLKHANGAVSMARTDPDSATGDFFICIGAQPQLDFGGKRNPDGQGFAAFGRVVRGMDVVKRIQQSPAEGQKLTPAIMIVKAKLR